VCVEFGRAVKQGYGSVNYDTYSCSAGWSWASISGPAPERAAHAV